MSGPSAPPRVISAFAASWLLGNRFLMFVHVGRRTGMRRETVHEVLSYRPDIPEWTVMSGFSPSGDWLRNIRVTQDPEAIVGRRHFRVLSQIFGWSHRVPSV